MGVASPLPGSRYKNDDDNDEDLHLLDPNFQRHREKKKEETEAMEAKTGINQAEPREKSGKEFNFFRFIYV